MIRILLAEDQAMVRGALAALLGLETDLAVVAEAGNGDAAWAAVQQHAPDLLVTDIEMPGITGLELAQRLHAAGHPTREVAQELCFSERTVKNVLHDVVTKLNARSRSQAVAFAVREGLI